MEQPIWIMIAFESESTKEKAIKTLEYGALLNKPGVSLHIAPCTISFASYMDSESFYEYAIEMKSKIEGLYTEIRFDGWTKII